MGLLSKLKTVIYLYWFFFFKYFFPEFLLIQRLLGSKGCSVLCQHRKPRERGPQAVVWHPPVGHLCSHSHLGASLPPLSHLPFSHGKWSDENVIDTFPRSLLSCWKYCVTNLQSPSPIISHLMDRSGQWIVSLLVGITLFWNYCFMSAFPEFPASSGGRFVSSSLQFWCLAQSGHLINSA